jgi:hypothetical protein
MNPKLGAFVVSVGMVLAALPAGAQDVQVAQAQPPKPPMAHRRKT